MNSESRFRWEKIKLPDNRASEPIEILEGFADTGNAISTKDTQQIRDILPQIDIDVLIEEAKSTRTN
jgi:hypothetical protein